MIAPTEGGFPPVRACLFDMDGLLIDTEDIYTKCNNIILQACDRPNLPWKIKAQLQGRPGPEAAEIFHAWAQLPISRDEFNERQRELQAKYFPDAKPLPGVESLLASLASSGSQLGNGDLKDHIGKVYLALATSSHAFNFRLKTFHQTQLFAVFPESQRLLGDDPRIPRGRGKPCPDIYLLALEQINQGIRERNALRHGKEATSALAAASTPANGHSPATTPTLVTTDEIEVSPAECLVFEDSVPGVEAGRRAGMRVVWCPHPQLLDEYRGREEEVLAGNASGVLPAPESADAVPNKGNRHEPPVMQHGKGSNSTEDTRHWAELVHSLKDFDYAKYGIRI